MHTVRKRDSIEHLRRKVRWQIGFRRSRKAESPRPFLAVNLAAETLDVSKDVLVNDADQPEEFEERVLKRRCSQKKLIEWGKGAFDRVPDLVCRLVDVAEPMASSMTAKFHATCQCTALWSRANWYEQMTISERLKGFRFPSLICSLKVLVSKQH